MATGLIATVLLSIVASVVWPYPSTALEVLVPQFVAATLWFIAAYTLSDLLYHAVKRD